MNRRSILAVAATILTGHILLAGIANAQKPSDIEAIKAAHQSFYAALSGRDVNAMAAVWANKPYVVNIGPGSKEVALGYEDAVTNYWPLIFDQFSEIDVKSTSIANIHVDGSVATVVGAESAVLQPKAGGEPRKFDLFVTNLFEKD